MVRTLEQAGYTVLTTQNGLEAVQAFEDNDVIDMVLMDMVMPVMGGVAAREHILETAPGALIMFSTGYSTEAAQAQYSISDKVPMVSKPYKPNDLLRRVREVLDGVAR